MPLHQEAEEIGRVKSSPGGSEKSALVQLFSVCHSGMRYSVTRFHGDGVTVAGALPK